MTPEERARFDKIKVYVDSTISGAGCFVGEWCASELPWLFNLLDCESKTAVLMDDIGKEVAVLLADEDGGHESELVAFIMSIADRYEALKK